MTCKVGCASDSEPSSLTYTARGRLFSRGHAGEDCEDHLYDNGHSATRSATGVRHGDTGGVESDAFCMYRRGKQIRVDL